MGTCNCFSLASTTNDQSRAHSEISGHMNVEADIDQQTRKLLLLGAGSSGKSTILKQMRYLYIYNGGYPDNERKKYRDIVYENLIAILIQLCQNCKSMNFQNDPSNDSKIEKLLNCDIKSILPSLNSNDEFKQILKSIWEDSGIRKTFDRRHDFTLMDNAHYLLDCMSRIIGNDYVPTFTDVVYTRSVTTGITQENFIFETSRGTKERYEIVDVGGQRTERKKWIQCFDEVLAVMFVIALSGYDQTLWEDHTVNRLEEALELLKKMAHTKSLKNAKFIVFLNKRDLFREKIGSVPFALSFNDEFSYNGNGHDYDEIIKYIKSIIRTFDEKRTFYFHVTCATDTEDVNRVFNICHNIVLRNAIERGGFL